MTSPTSSTPAPRSEDVDDAKKTSIFFQKLEKDIWEAWVWTGLGLAASALIIWIVAYLRLGYTSVYAYGVGIPLTSMLAVPIILWGLVKTMLNPPIMRMSRSIGFIALFSTAWIANSPLFTAPVSTLDWRSSHTYRLPFDGSWYTLSGGPERDTSYTVTAPALRFAYTFTRLTAEGATHSGDPLELASYPCYGSPILAPVAAEVVSTYTNQKDNVPHKPSQENMLGNHIVLKVDEQEFVILTFLKKDSILVEPGARVTPGQPIAQCGASGGAPLPMLQIYAVKDGEKLVLTEGLPIPFHHYEVGAEGARERVVSGTPLGSGDLENLTRGQTVTPFTP